MSYLKIDFIPQFTMEPLLNKGTHKYEKHVLRDIFTLDLKRLWFKSDVQTHFSYNHRTYWMIEGKANDLIRPWSMSPLKTFTRGIVYTILTGEDPEPIFKLENNRLIVLINTIDMNKNIKSIDGHVWDLTDPETKKLLRNVGLTMKHLHNTESVGRFSL